MSVVDHESHGEGAPGTDDLRGARFVHRDMAHVTIRDCDLTGLQIVDCVLGAAAISGEIDRLVVNDVDVTAYVEAELDRRQPERALVRRLGSADDYRSTWTAIEQMWAPTHERLAALPPAIVSARVGEEWSALDTLRHLIFATDAWAGRAVLGLDDGYHPAGLPASNYPPELAAELGLELDITPSLADLLVARGERMSLVADIVDGLTDNELARATDRAPSPAHPRTERTIGHCLEVVMFEEVEHHRYLVRDLAVLTAGAS